jgi:hypothetical protein
MPKQTNKSQHIGKGGVVIFQNILRKNYENKGLEFCPVPQEHDYGIDGFAQKFIEDVNTGLIYYFQIKTKEKLEISKNSKIIKLEISALEDVVENFKVPMIIIVVEESSEKCYWIDVKLNPELLESYKQAKLKNQQSLTIKLDAEKLLPKSFNEMIEYLKKLDLECAKEMIKESSKDKTISQKLGLKNSINSLVDLLPGMKYSLNKADENAVLKINDGENTYSFSPEDPSNPPNIRIKFTVKDDIQGMKDLIDRKKDRHELTEVMKILVDGKIVEEGQYNIKIDAIDDYCTVRLIDESDLENSEDVHCKIWRSSKFGEIKIESIEKDECPVTLKINVSNGVIKGGKMENVDIVLTVHADFEKCNRVGVNKSYRYLKRFLSLSAVIITTDSPPLKIIDNQKITELAPLIETLKKLNFIENKITNRFKTIFSQKYDSIIENRNISLAYNILNNNLKIFENFNYVIPEQERNNLFIGQFTRVYISSLPFQILGEQPNLIDQLSIDGQIKLIEEIETGDKNNRKFKIIINILNQEDIKV